MEYRIKEYVGQFTIQVKKPKTTGILWWRKTRDLWYSLDMYGNITAGTPNIMHIYPNLQMATQAIHEFIAGPKYHYIED